MRYTHRGQHVDGVWFHCFDTVDEVIEDMMKHLEGNIVPGEVIHEDCQYIDMFGGTHVYHLIPDSFDSEKMLLIEEAWDNRECGIINSDKQDELLEQWSFFETQKREHSFS